MKENKRFEIYSRDSLVGWSDLELGDAPMGVAFGRFIPATSYSDIQPQVVASYGSSQEHLRLSARTPSGELIECAGVCIEDHSADLGEGGLEVSVLGISEPPYDQLFPHHVAAYEQQFPSGS
ncbi:MAG: hypothetical protein QM719_08395 [Thermomonas sp.]